MKKRLVLAWAAAVGLSARTFADAAVSEDAAGIAGSGATGAVSVIAADAPPAKPDGGGGGGGTPPDMPSGGGASETIELTGALTFDGVTTNLTGGTVESTATNQNAVLAFEIDRTAFDRKYDSSQDEETKTYYFKPHAPTHAVVKVKYGETYLTPDMDHKYWLDSYWSNGVGVTVRIIYATQTGYFFADGTSSTNYFLTITENRLDVYPPAGFETAYKAQAKSGATYYPTLKKAIDNSKSQAMVTLNDNVTLEDTLTVTNSITLNLAANVITLGRSLTNAFVFASRVTVSNGTINSSFAADVDGSVLMRFADAKATLSDLVVNGQGYGAVVCSTGDGEIRILSGLYNASMVLLADDYGVFYKSDDVIIPAPAGYVWENCRLKAGASVESVTPGVASEAYGSALAATNAAAQINANRADCIVVPTGVEDFSKLTYLGKLEATVTDDNRVVVDLTDAAAADVQRVLDATVTNETAVAALTGTDASAKVTLATTTPGLYYWIRGGTEVSTLTSAGAGVLSMDGGSVELAKPTLDATKNRAFHRIAAGVAAPVASNAD